MKLFDPYKKKLAWLDEYVACEAQLRAATGAMDIYNIGLIEGKFPRDHERWLDRKLDAETKLAELVKASPFPSGNVAWSPGEVRRLSEHWEPAEALEERRWVKQAAINEGRKNIMKYLGADGVGQALLGRCFLKNEIDACLTVMEERSRLDVKREILKDGLGMAAAEPAPKPHRDLEF
jgi:hypothetical protein